MAPKKPHVTLLRPCPKHSLLGFPLVSVISSISVSVSKLSISPIPARVSENGKTINKVSKLNGTLGILN